MKTNWSTTVLIVSLAFNLAVLGVFLYITAFSKSPFQANIKEKRAQQITGNRLQPGQTGWAKSILKQNLEKNRPAIKQQANDRKQFIQTLTTDEFNEAKAKVALAKFVKSRSNMEEALGKSLIEMRKQITPAQLKQLMQRRSDWQNQMKNRQPGLGSQIFNNESDSLSENQYQMMEKIKERRLERRNLIRKRMIQKYRQSQP